MTDEDATASSRATESPAKPPAELNSRSPHRRGSILISWLGCIVIFALSIWLHTAPLWQARHHQELIVDERHLFDGSNADVEGSSSLLSLWINDYWGRSIHRHDSHKSWRPLTVLTFRYGKLPATSKIFGIFSVPRMSTITWHRFVNVLLHAVVAQLVGLVSRRVWMDTTRSLPFALAAGPQWLSILLFAWHPTHVEVVANAANRPHLLAILASCAVILLGTNRRDASLPQSSTSRIPYYAMWFGSGLVLALGLLCSETMVFQLPAILVTATLIHWRQLQQQRRHLQPWQKTSSTAPAMNENRNSPQSVGWVVLQNMLPLWAWWISLVLLYLGFRYWANTLSMPNDLLDRAEVPFHELQGWTRIYSFAYVVAIHIGKAVGIDWVGFAHEYSYNCIPPLESMQDSRMQIPVGMVVGIILVTIILYWRRRPQPTAITQPDGTQWQLNNNDDLDDDSLWLWLMVLSWFASLLPISGLVKVGTFVADRIVVPCTVGISISLGRVFLWLWTRPRPIPLRIALLVMTCWWWWGLGSVRILQRTREWTQNDLLFLRTKETCPSSAKNLLQLSKLHSAPSGTHRALQQDLDIALSLVKQSRAVDPDFCRVQYQFAHVYLQVPNYKKMEKHLAQALVCPNTGAMAMELWNKYWPAMAEQDPTALARRDGYIETIMAPKKKKKKKSKQRQSKRNVASARGKDKEL